MGILLLVAACMDAPLAPPTTSAGPGTIRVAPLLSLSGAIAGTPQADALNAAFDRVDRFRLVIRRASNDEIVVDTIIVVTPGQSTYDLSSPVPSVVPDEKFVVSITAMQGTVTLFESPPIAVSSVPANAPAGAAQSPKIELAYSGPGAAAASVTVTPGAALLGPGATRALAASVLGASGSPVVGVPLSWSSSVPTVATVSSTGVVTTLAEGATRVAATTPTGLSAATWIYVASGEIAFVQDGHVRARSLLGGAITDASPTASAASAPTYGPGGGPLAWADGGTVFVGGRAITEGEWPAVSPDGTKLAVERGGRVFFANIDGSNATAGPAGTAPAWMPDNASLLVGGGSIQRVKADGSGRTTVVAGAAALPALGGAGQIAFTSGSSLQVQGKGTVATGVSGRGAFSPSARWLLASTGADLVLADANGLAPQLALGIVGATDPVWRGAAPSGGSPSLALTALAPAPVIPGAELRIVGQGFDFAIPANNSVFFPSAAGPVRGIVKAASETQLTTVMPMGTTAGSIRVVSPNGEATIPYVPTVGSIRVTALIGGSTAAPGMPIVVSRGGAPVGTATTDGAGTASFDLTPGSYSVALAIPVGYRVLGSNPVPVTLAYEVREVTFDVGVVPTEVTITPSSPITVDAGSPVTVRVHAFDADHAEIPSFSSIRWVGSAKVGATGSTLEGVITATSASRDPGDAPFAVYLDGQVFEFGATARVFVEGRVTLSGAGAGGVTVTLKDSIGAVVATTTTDGGGVYRFSRLMGGQYKLEVTAPGALAVSPAQRTVTLGAPATGQDFTIGGGGGAPTGPLRANVMVCGSTSHSPTAFYPAGTNFALVTGCTPDANTQALFMTRYASGYNALQLQGYVSAGGIVITEYSNSYAVWNAIFATAVGPGSGYGSCTDIFPSVVQMNAADPFWQSIVFQAIPLSGTGCGQSVSHFPGIVPLGGWDATHAALGYRDLGSGRVWAADWDWQDSENYPEKPYTESVLGYLMTHRAFAP